MEFIFIFLANAILSGAAYDLVKNKLNKIDKNLMPFLVKSKDPKEWNDYIQENQIESEVLTSVQDIIKNTVVLPVIPDKQLNFSAKCDLFLSILRVVFGYSYHYKMDILLPSSILHPDYFSLFTGCESAQPDIKRIDMRIPLNPLSTNLYTAKLFIFPNENDIQTEQLWNVYLKRLIGFRHESPNYFHVSEQIPEISFNYGDCQVCNISAGTCYFENTLMINNNLKEKLKIRDGGAPIHHWQEGVSKMISSLETLISNLKLPDSDGSGIRTLHNQIIQLLNKSYDELGTVRN